MSYPQYLIYDILRAFIRVEAVNSEELLQVLPFQPLDSEILKNTLKDFNKEKICYLLISREGTYHALLITCKENRVKCNYIYMDEAQLSPEIILAHFKRAAIQVNFSMMSLGNYLNESSKAVAFTEALGQLLIQEKISTLDIKNAIPKHLKICQRSVEPASTIHSSSEQSIKLLLNICQQIASSTLSKLKEEDLLADKLIRLLAIYNYLIQFIRKNDLSFPQYYAEKMRIYKIRNHNSDEFLPLFDQENLAAIINAHSSTELFIYLEKQTKENLSTLLHLEQEKFPIILTTQKFLELAQVFYYTSPICIYGELIAQLPKLASLLSKNNFVLNTNQLILKNITFNQVLRAIGMMTGLYALINSRPYYIVKPLITFYASQNLATYLHSERYNDQLAKTLAPFVKYNLTASDWYLIILNTLLLLEAFFSQDARQPVYVGLAIATNLLLTTLATWLIPSFKDKLNPSNPHERVTLLMLFTLLSRAISSLLAGYGFYVFDQRTACTETVKQFKNLTAGEVVAIETRCSSAWIPNFFNANKKLNIHATNTKGRTYQLSCDLKNDRLDKVANCKIIKEYKHLLIPSK